MNTIKNKKTPTEICFTTKISLRYLFFIFFIPVCSKIIQGVEPIWLEKGLFWLETNRMAKKTLNFHTGKCILCYCRCFIEMCALIP